MNVVSIGVDYSFDRIDTREHMKWYVNIYGNNFANAICNTTEKIVRFGKNR
jgi:hypothetical protein